MKNTNPAIKLTSMLMTAWMTLTPLQAFASGTEIGKQINTKVGSINKSISGSKSGVHTGNIGSKSQSGVETGDIGSKSKSKAKSKASNGDQELNFEDNSQESFESHDKAGAATNVASSDLQTAKELIQTCLFRFNIGASAGGVFGNYGGFNISYHPGVGVLILNEETDEIFTPIELIAATPKKRGVMTKGMSNSEKELAICTGVILSQKSENSDRTHAHEIARMTHKHNLGRTSNLPGKRTGASTLEHLQVQLYTGKINPSYMQSLACATKAFKKAGGTGKLNATNIPTPTEALLAMLAPDQNQGIEGCQIPETAETPITTVAPTGQ